MNILSPLIFLFGLILVVFGVIYIYEAITHWFRTRKVLRKPVITQPATPYKFTPETPKETTRIES